MNPKSVSPVMVMWWQSGQVFAVNFRVAGVRLDSRFPPLGGGTGTRPGQFGEPEGIIRGTGGNRREPLVPWGVVFGGCGSLSCAVYFDDGEGVGAGAVVLPKCFGECGVFEADAHFAGKFSGVAHG